MKVRLFEERDRERWDEYVMSLDSSACYHQTGWKDVIQNSFGHKTYYLLAENERNEINGILPLVHQRSALFGNYIISLPYFNYGGIYASSGESLALLMEEAKKIAVRENVAHIELRHTQNIDKGLPVKTAKVSMRLELPLTSDEMMKNFPAKLRSQIRKPQKEGMYVKIGREELLESFYDVFSVNMRDLGTPVYAKSFFRNILHQFPESTWICTVYKEKTPVASGFLAGFKEMLQIPWASSLRGYNRYSPNMLLYWSVLDFACGRGFRVFDFGRSTPGEGTYKFKEQWGAKPTQLYWHYWLRNGGALPEINPKNQKYQMMIGVWQKLPVSLTKLVGPYIVKNLP